ncbi:hypothetical protein SUGI_1063600 [Cryptomeria japonica]|nr:hypothetical protein SUGI_1063600 [Cryptomeria japonica]
MLLTVKEARRPENLITSLSEKIPPLQGTDLIIYFRYKSHPMFEILLYESDMQKKVDYMLVNSIEELEGSEAVAELSQTCPALAIGPVFLPESLQGTENSLHELPLGLEASEQPFLWVLRNDIADGKPAVLPEGFLERVKGRAMFVNWAPQLKVLSHPSVGGFLTHNGWNSTMESMSMGVVA